MKIKCVAVDDEPLALELLERNIQQNDTFELISLFSNSAKALSFLQKNKVDLVFLDIQMPGINGMELSKKLDPRTGIIFTTAFDQYAVESYNVDAIDYLLKPIDNERFQKACERAVEFFNRKNAGGTNNKIQISSEHEKFIINTDEILFIEGLKDYVKIHIEGAVKPLLTRMNLKTFEATYGADKFLRIHKSYLVNRKHIRSYSSRVLVLFNGHELPVGDSYKQFLIQQKG